MQFTTTVLSALALAGSALAQSVSGPAFNLVVYSQNATYNGTYLTTCHEGAAIESLCLYGGDKAVFYHNITKGAQSPIKYDSAPGTLNWYLNASPHGEYQAMGLYLEQSTNVARATFGLAPVTQVAFDNNNAMNIQSYYDDSVVPPTTTIPRSYYDWFICETNFEAYTYLTLNWVYSGDVTKPRNPSCVRADIRRRLIPTPAPAASN